MPTTKPAPSPARPAGRATRSINLALQGGGSHGAFTWGVLDALLEDGRVSLEGIGGTSAGAMNAVALASGQAQARGTKGKTEVFSGNPAIHPLICNCASRDIVLVQINPIRRQTLPTSSSRIMGRINEVTFNAGLIHSLRDMGRASAKAWLAKHFHALGTKCSVNIKRDYLDDLPVPV